MAGHPPVAQEHYPVGPGGQLRVVGHHHRGHAPLACLVQQPHHLAGVHRVQRAGRLVGQQQPAVPHHRAGDRYPLPLAAGQLIGEPARPVGHAERFQRGQPGRARLRHRDAVQFQRQGGVLGGGQPGQQVEILEHVPDHPAPQPGLAAPRHPGQRHAADQHLPAGGVLQAPGDGQQRGLARPARPHHRHHLPGPHRQVDPGQRVHRGRLLPVGLRHAAQLQHAHRAPVLSRPLIAWPPAGEAAEPEPAGGSGPGRLGGGPRQPHLRGVQPPDHRVQPEQLGIDHQRQAQVVAGLALLQPRPLLHQLQQVHAVRLDHLMRVGARHPRRHQHLHHQLVTRRGGQVRRRAQPVGQRLPAAGRDPEPLLRPVLAGAVGLGQPVALQPAQRLVHLADVQRPHLAGPGLELLAQLQPVLRPLRQQRQQHVRDAHDITMPNIMPDIIPGIKMVCHKI